MHTFWRGFVKVVLGIIGYSLMVGLAGTMWCVVWNWFMRPQWHISVVESVVLFGFIAAACVAGKYVGD